MTQPNRLSLALTFLAPLLLAGCAPGEEAPGDDAASRPGPGSAIAGEEVAGEAEAAGSLPEPQQAFWSHLTELCGQAYTGGITASAPEGADDDFAGREMVMHVRACDDDEIRIPFHVGQDRSRTWVITRTGDGLRLKHDHRHEDGSPDELTMYGGDTAEEGTATRQAFPADAATAEMLPAAATNVWTLEVEPGRTFAYELRREGTDRRFRAEFDLTSPVDPPPAPWGTD